MGRNLGWIAQRGTQDGAGYIADMALSASIEGRMWGASFGTLTTPLATAATTAITTLRPQMWLRIPDGYAIIPASIRLLVEANGATTQGEALIGTVASDVGNGTSAAATLGPISLNTAAPLTSGVTARQLATADVSAEFTIEHKRFSFAASAVNQDFNWNPLQEHVYLVLRGPASLMVYVGGNAVNFFGQIQWIELPESAVS